MGRLVRDPEVRYSQNGESPMAVARFSLAVDRSKPIIVERDSDGLKFRN